MSEHVTPCYSDECAPCLVLRLKSKENALRVSNERVKELEARLASEKKGASND